MGALLDNAALVQDHDLVRSHDCGQPVSDEHDTAAAGHVDHELVQRLLHLALVLGVQRRGRLVQQQQRGPPQQRPGDGEALPLAAAEAHAALADHRAVALIEVFDELVRVCRPRGRGDLLVGDGVLRQPVHDVVPNGPAEDLCLLGDNAYPLLIRAQVELGEGCTIQEDAATLRVVEAKQEAHQRALAGTTSADHGHGAAGRDGEAEALEDLLLRPHLVRELEILELHGAGGASLEAQRPGVHRDVRFEVDDLEHALRGRGGADQRVQHTIEASDGVAEHLPIQVERDEVADGKFRLLPVHDTQNGDAAIPEDQNRGGELQVLRDRGDTGGSVGVLHPVAEPLIDVPAEGAHLEVVGGEGAHRPDVLQRLRRHRVGVRQAHPDSHIQLLRPDRIDPRQIDHWSNHGAG
mmetsp:Transcript_65391/g.184606  ORF Transcript_65391/g.184606 Transcript_65391/m.184606 type:complete len:408 (-) Transcript_65391:1382-2605(-)